MSSSSRLMVRIAKFPQAGPSPSRKPLRRKSATRRRLLAESLESRQLLAADDLVEFVLTARDIQTDALLANTQNVTEVTSSSTEVIEYQVGQGDIFKLEVAVQDLRGAGGTGVFRAAADILIEQKDVLEPAIGEAQSIIFSNDILSPSAPAGQIKFFLASNPGNQVNSSLINFLGGSDQDVEAFVANAVATLMSEVESADQVTVSTTVNPASGGPNGGGSYGVHILFSDPDLVGVNVPQLQVELVMGGQAQAITLEEHDVKLPDDSFNPEALIRNFEVNSRTANGVKVYGSERQFGMFDATNAGHDLFDEVGVLGPTTNLPILLSQVNQSYNHNVAYDAFSIPVRALVPAQNVSVRLQPASTNDTVMVYGTTEGKEIVPVDKLAFEQSSQILIDISEPLPELEAGNGPLNVTEDDSNGESVDLSTLVTTTSTDPVTFEVFEQGEFGNATISGNNLTYTPAADRFGDDTVIYLARTGGIVTDTGTINVSIAPVNDPPAASADSVLVEKGGSISIEVLANDSAGPFEPQSQLSLSSVGTPSHGTVSISNGKAFYRPNGNYVGDDSFTYEASDGSATSTGTVTIDVVEAVVAGNATVSVTEDQAASQIADLTSLVTVNLGSNNLSFSLVSFDSSKGSASIVNDKLNYQPNPHVFGETSITYRVSNSLGNSTGVITVNVQAVNDPPTAEADSVRTNPGETLTINVADLLSNDSAGPLESAQTLSITSVGSAAVNGSTTQLDGNFIFYTPASGFAGSDSFTYTLSDGSSSTTGTVSVDVSFLVESVTLNLPDPQSNDVTIRRDGDNIVVFDNASQVFLLNRPRSTIIDLELVGQGNSSDHVHLNHRAGGLVTFTDPNKEIVFTAGGGSDELVVSGTVSGVVQLAHFGSGSPTIADGLLATITDANSQNKLRTTGVESITLDQTKEVFVNSSSSLNIGSHELILDVTDPLRLSQSTTLASGALRSTSPVLLQSGQSLSGNGTVDAPVDANLGSTIQATGDLTLGKASSALGVQIAGTLQVGANSVTLNDANGATLAGQTTIGAGSNLGTLNTPSGLQISAGGSVSGRGEINASAGSNTSINNLGSIAGSSASARLSLNGFVEGTGTFNNVAISDTFSPGNGPAVSNNGNVLYGENATLIVELGGSAPGSGYDQVRHNTGGQLDGDLQVNLVNGFQPAAGHVFDIITGSPLSGTFETTTLPGLTNGLKWSVAQSASKIALGTIIDVASLNDEVSFNMVNGQLVVRGQNGQQVPVAGSVITVEASSTQKFESTETWTITGNEKVEGELYQVATDGTTTVRVKGAGWTNFVNRNDVNGSGDVSALDALRVINELNRRAFSSDADSNLVDPLSVAEFPDTFYDVNADGRVSALDALRVINKLVEQDLSSEPLAPATGNHFLDSAVYDPSVETDESSPQDFSSSKVTSNDAVLAGWDASTESASQLLLETASPSSVGTDSESVLDLLSDQEFGTASGR